MRELKSAEEIREEVNRIANTAVASAGKAGAVAVGAAMYLREPDATGCNWYLDFLGPLHLNEIGTALRTVKGKWNLPRRD